MNTIQPAPREHGSSLLHNMSAPPRLSVVLHPLQIHEDGQAATGTRLLGVVDMDSLFGRHLSKPERTELETARQKTLLLADRLAGTGLPAETYRTLSEEAVFDRFNAAMENIPPPPLPPFAPMVRLPPRKTGNPVFQEKEIRDLPLALALVARLSGTLFLKNRPPHLPSGETLGQPLAFFVLEGEEK